MPFMMLFIVASERTRRGYRSSTGNYSTDIFQVDVSPAKSSILIINEVFFAIIKST